MEERGGGLCTSSTAEARRGLSRRVCRPSLRLLVDLQSSTPRVMITSQIHCCR